MALGLKSTIESVLNRVRTITVTNGDGNVVNMHCEPFNNQPQRRRDGTGYDYQTPATFIETILSDGEQIGGGSTSYTCTFNVILEMDLLNVESSLDTNLLVLDIRDTLHRYLNNFKPQNCSPMMQTGTPLDHNHDNIYTCVMTYVCNFTDLVSTVYDTVMGYTNEIVQNLELEIEDTFVPALPTTPNPEVSIVMIDIIERIRVQQPEPWKVAITILSAVAMEGNTYTIDWDDTTSISANIGIEVVHTYNVGSTYLIAIISNNGALINFAINMNESGILTAYPTSITQSIDYSINSIYYPDYPITVNAAISVNSGTLPRIWYYLDGSLENSMLPMPLTYNYQSVIQKGAHNVLLAVVHSEFADLIQMSSIISIDSN